MPQPVSLDTLQLPGDSEVPALLAACPSIALLKFSDNEFLTRAGEQRQEVYLVMRGSCLVQRAGAGEIRRPGDELAVFDATPESPVFVGEMAYLAGGPRTASVRSAMNVWALRLEPPHLDAIIAGFPALTQILCRQFARRLSETNATLERLSERHVMHTEHRFHQPGDLIFPAGIPADGLYQLVDGEVSLTPPSGAAQTLEATGPTPCMLNARAYFRALPNDAEARALGTCMLVVIAPESRLAAVRNFPELVLSL